MQAIYRKHAFVLFWFFPDFFFLNEKLKNTECKSSPLPVTFLLQCYIGISLLTESTKVINY